MIDSAYDTIMIDGSHVARFHKRGMDAYPEEQNGHTDSQ